MTRDRSWIIKAQTSCRQAVTLAGDQSAGHICLGLVNSATGHYEQAVDEFQHAAKLEPTSDEAYLGLGKAYEELGRFDLAETTYKQAIGLRPAIWGGYHWLGAFT